MSARTTKKIPRKTPTRRTPAAPNAPTYSRAEIERKLTELEGSMNVLAELADRALFMFRELEDAQKRKAGAR